MRKSYRKLPYAYFIGISLWICLEDLLAGHFSSLILILISVPFIYQWNAEEQGLNLTLGVLVTFWAILMLLAWLSDLAKLVHVTDDLRFLIVGGIFTFLNFIMAFHLIRKALHKNNAAREAA